MKQAVEHGKQEAPSSLAPLQGRDARQADIAHYTRHVDGAHVAYGKIARVYPTISAVSTETGKLCR